MSRLYSITFTNKNNDQKTIKFSNVNVILGEKGSGKSTFLRIIAEVLSKTKIFTKDDFVQKEFNLSVKHANIDNEIKSWNSFSTLTSSATDYEKKLQQLKEIFEVYIVQNDNRKKSLSDIYSKEIKWNKKSIYFSELLNQIKKNNIQFEFIENIKLLNNSLEEWSSFFKKSNDLNLNVIYENITQNSNNYPLWKNDVRLDIKKLNLEQTRENLEQTINKLNDPQLLQTFIGNQNDFLNSIFQKQNQKLALLDEKISVLIQNKIEIYKKAIILIQKLEQLFIKFNNAYTKASNNISETMQKAEKNQSSFNKLKEFFAHIPKYLKNLKTNFDLVNNFDIETNINFAIEPLAHKKFSSINYSLPPFKLSEKQISKIIKIISKGKASGRVPKDLLTLIKKPEEFSTNTNNTAMEEIYEDLISTHHKIYVEGKIYEELSNGQKSLFGIKNTINNANEYKDTSNFLLLDQIEDDLDAWTVVEEIIPLLNKLIKQGKQIFIVTHDPNVGTLLENSISITIDLRQNNLEDKFKINAIFDKTNTAETRYLEGGMNSLEKRVQINNEKLQGVNNG
ncbi:hypothetical protein EG856_00070 [Mycoplasmopsis phocirhinis]|uniref:ATP-binding cassette domain-containing protein n=1 Tax=Mycoplasmopsis phocirhinis TaxID=142650 RepID=A0A4P6MSS6_9BACT|nr:ABC transporter ATP-binding protein [Mycoplasmopsis phocirhinis]QBF34337.1 hypothetical protein EG856_00070 [Mycoplasmopsis phocirhinis]